MTSICGLDYARLWAYSGLWGVSKGLAGTRAQTPRSDRDQVRCCMHEQSVCVFQSFVPVVLCWWKQKWHSQVSAALPVSQISPPHSLRPLQMWAKSRHSFPPPFLVPFSLSNTFIRVPLSFFTVLVSLFAFLAKPIAHFILHFQDNQLGMGIKTVCKLN